ncbi:MULTISPECIES: ribbon-helix-helix protein, CopG family [Aphanothece]|uniref:ribbon-helix-helix protein, CopG family n=1 Tax=Aphanothece TaxID=1121 RepID=UPI003985307C
MADDDQQDRRKISLQLSAELIERLDALKGELGCRSRGAIVERLLHNLLDGEENGEDSPDGLADEGAGSAGQTHQLVLTTPAEVPPSRFDESSALVLVGRSSGGQLLADQERDHPDDHPDPPPGQGERAARRTSRGIDLPGFVQRRTDQLRRSLHHEPTSDPGRVEPLPQVSATRIDSALQRAREHWLELYGQEANEAVLEAAMLWMAQELWPQSDQSEGRPFTWSLASDVLQTLAPSWLPGPASFERVMVMAGVLEDPFSTATLELRIPTLIRRFVHRFRRRRRGTSFQTLEHTMTVHGALRLLQLPTDPGQRFTLPQIREAYRQMALAQHPDAGGSEEAMRRLNEAYQLLKELYRTG